MPFGKLTIGAVMGLNVTEDKKVYWYGPVGNCNICKQPLQTVMYDSNTRLGWANVCEECFTNYGTGLGTGRGQQYSKLPDGRWIKTGG